MCGTVGEKRLGLMSSCYDFYTLLKDEASVGESSCNVPFIADIYDDGGFDERPKGRFMSYVPLQNLEKREVLGLAMLSREQIRSSAVKILFLILTSGTPTKSRFVKYQDE